MAHEIRNPLGAIKGAAQCLNPDELGDESKEFLDVIVEEVDGLAVGQSRILVADPGHKLTVIEWLIEHQRIDSARHELRLLIRHVDENIRLRTLQVAQGLPAPHGKAFTQIAMTDRSPKLRIAAIRIVRNDEDELLSRWLIAQLAHADAAVACAAAESFGFFFDQEEAMLLTKYTALNALIRMAEQSAPHTQSCAIEALGHSERYRALQPLITLLDSSDRTIRLAAVKALGLLKDKAAIRPLEALFLASGESVANRTQALVAIKQIDSDYELRTLLAKGSRSQPEYSARQSYTGILQYAYNEAEHGILIRSELLKYFEESGWQTPVERAGQAGEQASAAQQSALRPCGDEADGPFPVEAREFVDYLDRCLAEAVFFRHMPRYVENGLQRDNERLRIEIHKRLATRKERWAREQTLAALNDAGASIDLQRAILENLPAEPSPALSRQLGQRFASRPDSELAPYIAKRLLDSGSTEIVDTVLEQIAANLHAANEHRALLYAAALVEYRPDAVLSLLLGE